jgi:ATP-dependent RNA helicase DeaD
MPGTIKQLVQNYLNKNVVQVSAAWKVGNQGIDHVYCSRSIEKIRCFNAFSEFKRREKRSLFCKTKAAVNN